MPVVNDEIGHLCRFAGFKEAERERLASHFKSNFKLDMLDRELAVKVE